MAEKLPELRRPPAEHAVGRPAPQKGRQRSGGSALFDLLRNLDTWENLDPELEEWEIRYAATGAAATLAAAGVGLLLPESASISKGGFDIFGITEQEIAVASGLLEGLVAIMRFAIWPLAVLGVGGLVVDAYLAVRPRQPIAWHYVCVSQMLLGFLAGCTITAIFGIVLANIVVGLLAAALIAIVALVFIGIAVGILSIFSDS